MKIRILLFCLLASAYTMSNAQTSTYKVTKIKTVRKYYLIYVLKNDSVYKIVSKKEKISNCKKIKKNGSYLLNLSKVLSMAGPEVDCFSFDEKTVICGESDAELAVSSNLKGLCLIDR